MVRSGENRASELGPSQCKWWKDWRGECVAIVASGPSTSKALVDKLHNRIHVIAIKRNIELCPWADVVYGCDDHWWRTVRGLPDYKGLRLSWVDGGCKHFSNIHKIEIEKNTDRILLQQPGRIGSGGNSGFQALNIAVQFGATGILLLGFDMHDRSGAHWYGRNDWLNANNPSEDNFRRWQKAFIGAAGELSAMGVEVINTSPISALKCFRRKMVDQALAGWGL